MKKEYYVIQNNSQTNDKFLIDPTKDYESNETNILYFNNREDAENYLKACNYNNLNSLEIVKTNRIYDVYESNYRGDLLVDSFDTIKEAQNYVSKNNGTYFQKSFSVVNQYQQKNEGECFQELLNFLNNLDNINSKK